MSHVDLKLIATIKETMEKHLDNSIITRGGNQNFLGMDIGILEYNKLEIGINSYIHEVINFYEDVSTKVSYLKKCKYVQS